MCSNYSTIMVQILGVCADNNYAQRKLKIIKKTLLFQRNETLKLSPPGNGDTLIIYWPSGAKAFSLDMVAIQTSM